MLSKTRKTRPLPIRRPRAPEMPTARQSQVLRPASEQPARAVRGVIPFSPTEPARAAHPELAQSRSLRAQVEMPALLRTGARQGALQERLEPPPKIITPPS